MELGIENAEALTRIFGGWPSFHDAEVLTLTLDRHGDAAPILIAQIHLWRTTGKVDARGFFERVDSTRVTLRFEVVVLEMLRGFNAQNVLSDLVIERVPMRELVAVLREHLLTPPGDEDWLRVHFAGIYGCEATFVCRSVQVVSVAPHPLD